MKPVLLAFTSSNVGGAEKSLLRFYHSNEFDDLRGDVYFWHKGGPAEKLIERDISRNISEAIDNELGRYSFAYVLAYIFRLKDLLPLMYNHGCVYAIGWRLSLLIRLISFVGPKKRVIVGIRWVPSSNSKFDRLFRLCEPLLQYFTDGYICNSNSAASVLSSIKILDEKIFVAHNGILPPTKRKKNIVKPFFEIVTVANHAPRKGLLEYLDKVIVPLTNFNTDLRFIFIGRDDMDGALEEKIKFHNLHSIVKIVGYTENVSDYLSPADLFVLPSIYGEGCPTSVIEAKSYGVPCIGFNIDGMNECIVNGKTGFLIEKYDYSKMKDCISELYNDNKKLSKFKENSKKYFLENFNINMASGIHARVILKLVGKD